MLLINNFLLQYQIKLHVISDLAPKYHMTSSTPAYKVSKAAVSMLIMQYALNLAHEGFTFILVNPGVSKLSSKPRRSSCKALLYTVASVRYGIP